MALFVLADGEMGRREGKERPPTLARSRHAGGRGGSKGQKERYDLQRSLSAYSLQMNEYACSAEVLVEGAPCFAVIWITLRCGGSWEESRAQRAPDVC